MAGTQSQTAIQADQLISAPADGSTDTVLCTLGKSHILMLLFNLLTSAVNAATASLFATHPDPGTSCYSRCVFITDAISVLQAGLGVILPAFWVFRVYAWKDRKVPKTELCCQV